MAGAMGWLPLVTVGAGLVSAAFLRYLWPYRHEPGGWFFLGTIASETLWILSYGVALFVFDPAHRELFEVPIWLGINFIGVGFLAFALEYTGRGDLVRSPWMAALALLQLAHTVIVATNPVHHLAWSDYAVTPFLGAATVTYTHTPWLVVNFSGVFLMVAAGAFLLFDAFFSYGRLYRLQAAAIALSPVLPGLAFLAWLVPVGPFPPLNPTPLTFPIHLGLVGYAFFRRNMFELTPAARRASERSAIEDLGSAVVVVDDGERVIDLNAEARRALDLGDESILGRALADVLPDVDPSGPDGTVSLSADGVRREYAVSTASLEDPSGRSVGHSIVLQDITDEKQREQRLAVLNRVLRHNLRNDLNVVQGNLGLASEATDDPELAAQLDRAGDRAEALMELAEKARRLQDTLDIDDPTAGSVRLRALLEDIAADLDDGVGEVTVEVPADLRLQGRESLLEAVFRSLLENGLEHNPDADARVAVRVVDWKPDGGTATVTVEDNGPGVPDHEIEVINTGEETPLEHASGLGLWLVSWGVTALGGEIDFETAEAGTTARLVLPTAEPSGAQGPVTSS